MELVRSFYSLFQVLLKELNISVRAVISVHNQIVCVRTLCIDPMLLYIGPLVFDYTKSNDDLQNMEYHPYGWTQV